MKIFNLLTFFFLLASVSAQKLEVHSDLTEMKIEKGSSILITDEGFYNYNGSEINYISNNDKVKKSKSWFELKSNYLDNSKARKGRLFVHCSPGLNLDGHLITLVHFVTNTRKHQIIRIEVDENLNLIEEKLMTEFEYSSLSEIAENTSQEIFRCDANSGFFYFEQYINPTKKTDILSLAIFSPSMEFGSKSTFTLEIVYTDEESLYRANIPKVEIINEYIGLVNLNRRLYVIEDEKISPLKMDLDYNITSYVFTSSEKGRPRFVGTYRTDKSEIGIAMVDFNEDQTMENIKYVLLPKDAYASRKELTGFGQNSEEDKKELKIDAVKVDELGNTMLVYGVNIRPFYRENFLAIKISPQGALESMETLPWEGGYNQQAKFIGNVCYIVFSDASEKYDRDGKYSNGENKFRYDNKELKSAVAKFDFTSMQSLRNLIKIDIDNVYKGKFDNSYIQVNDYINSNLTINVILETGGAKNNYFQATGTLVLP